MGAFVGGCVNFQRKSQVLIRKCDDFSGGKVNPAVLLMKLTSFAFLFISISILCNCNSIFVSVSQLTDCGILSSGT